MGHIKADNHSHIFLLLGLISGITTVSETLDIFLSLSNLLLQELLVLQTEFLTNDFDITKGIKFTFNVNDIRLIESTDNVIDSINSLDMGQESISQTSTGSSTLHQTSNIDDGQLKEDGVKRPAYILDRAHSNYTVLMLTTHVSRDLLGGLVVLAKPVETSIGNSNSRFLGI